MRYGDDDCCRKDNWSKIGEGLIDADLAFHGGTTILTIRQTGITILLAILLAITGCNLELDDAAATEEPILEPTQTPIRSTPAPATETPTPVPPTTTPVVVRGCQIPEGWRAYTVIGGDTLFGIATRNQTTVAEITSGNCLGNANQISVGQVLYVPDNRPPTDVPSATPDLDSDSETGFLEVYLMVRGDGGANSIPVGCDDSAVIQETAEMVTGTLSERIRAEFEYLMDLDIGDPVATNEGQINPLFGQIIDLREVSVSGDQVTVEFGGNLQLIGTCYDALLEMQLVMTALHFPQINSARILVGGRNARQTFDMSGLVGPNAVYTRNDLPQEAQ